MVEGKDQRQKTQDRNWITRLDKRAGLEEVHSILRGKKELPCIDIHSL